MEAKRSLFDLGRLWMNLQDLLGCPVDVETGKGLKGRTRARTAGGKATLRDDKEELRDILEAMERIERQQCGMSSRAQSG